MGFLTSIFGGEETSFWSIGIALVVVLLLIVLAVWLLKMIFGATSHIARGRNRRLAVIDTLPVDAKRSLILVRRDDVEHLLLIGTAHDTLVESNIEAPDAATANAPVPTVHVEGDNDEQRRMSAASRLGLTGILRRQNAASAEAQASVDKTEALAVPVEQRSANRQPAPTVATQQRPVPAAQPQARSAPSRGAKAATEKTESSKSEADAQSADEPAANTGAAAAAAAMAAVAANVQANITSSEEPAPSGSETSAAQEETRLTPTEAAVQDERAGHDEADRASDRQSPPAQDEPDTTVAAASEPVDAETGPKPTLSPNITPEELAAPAEAGADSEPDVQSAALSPLERLKALGMRPDEVEPKAETSGLRRSELLKPSAAPLSSEEAEQSVNVGDVIAEIKAHMLADSDTVAGQPADEGETPAATEQDQSAADDDGEINFPEAEERRSLDG